jgi:tetratricopeptide (TPR) repeat protein
MDSIRQLIYDGETEMAIRLLDEYAADYPCTDEFYYLRGNAYRKEGNNRLALCDYLKAIELNPDSPAREAHDLLMKILAFYNKDSYNP